MKTLRNFNVEECREFALNLRNNAETKWHSGCLVEQVDKRTAVSNWITGIEEYTKACIFILDSRGTYFRSVEGIEELIKHHKARSVFICLIFIMKLYGEIFLKYLQNFMSDQSKLLSFVTLLKNGDEKTLQYLMEYLLSIIKKIKTEAVWFSSLEDLRLSCTYLDSSFNVKKFENEYEEIKIKLQQTRLALSELFNSFESDEWIDLNSKCIEIFNNEEKHFYEDISKFLINQRIKKSNPLKAFIKDLEDLEIEKSLDINNIDLKKFKGRNEKIEF